MSDQKYNYTQGEQLDSSLILHTLISLPDATRTPSFLLWAWSTSEYLSSIRLPLMSIYWKASFTWFSSKAHPLEPLIDRELS